jgi:serine/threonine protein kinase/formylglycine-generating enzyme required for sulfatase activity
MQDQPQQLDHYRVIRRLGSGGMADVYEALDERLDRHVALKVLPAEFAREQERVARFQQEIKSTAKLDHPNIVTVYDTGCDNGVLYYTMALLPGGELRNKIRHGLDHEQVCTILGEIAEALGHAHAKGFVHRDLKPENVMFDAHGRAVLTDLGIAKTLDSTMTRTGMSIGTPYYMSPEQSKGEPVDGRSDLYSAGVLLYKMLTGVHLFDAEDSFTIALCHINDPPPELPPEHARFQPIMDKLVAKRPEDRYQSAAELAEALKRLAQGADLSEPDSPAELEATEFYPTDPSAVITPGDEMAETELAPSGQQVLEGSLQPSSKSLQPEKNSPQPESESPQPENNGPQPEIASSQRSGNDTQSEPRQGKWLAIVATLLVCALLGAGGYYYATTSTTEAPPVVKSNAPAFPAVLAGNAILQLRSQPSGAEVYLGEHKLGVTPLFVENLAAGDVEVVVRKRYFADGKQQLSLQDSQVTKGEIVLARGRGGLSVVPTEADAWVRLNGELLDQKTPLTLDAIAAGEYRIEVGFKDAYYAGRVEVDHGATELIKPTLVANQLLPLGDRWLTVETLLQAAEEQVKAGNKLTPRVGALALYRLILQHRDDNPEARQGISALLQNYQHQLKQAIDKQRFKDAEDLLSLLGKHFPGEDQGALVQKLKDARQAVEKKGQDQRQREFVQRFQQLLKGHHFSHAENLLQAHQASGGAEDKSLKQSLAEARRQYAEKVERFSGELVELPLEKGASSQLKLGKTEVTFAQWDACVADGDCQHRPDDQGWGRGQRPVINVSYEDIVSEFIPWLNRKTGEQFRLPSLQEWQYAAQAGQSGLYPWGNSVNGRFANGSQKLGWRDDGETYSAPVATYPANDFGLHDMAGNVWEWTADCSGGAGSDSNCNRRIAKGGSWFSAPKFLQVGQQMAVSRFSRSHDRGFRLAQDKPLPQTQQ